MVLAGDATAGPAATVSIGESPDKIGSIDLPSGMRIVIEEDRSKPVVAMITVINAGAADHPVGKEGLAHLVEHLTLRARPDGRTGDFRAFPTYSGPSRPLAETRRDVRR